MTGVKARADAVGDAEADGFGLGDADGVLKNTPSVGGGAFVISGNRIGEDGGTIKSTYSAFHQRSLGAHRVGGKHGGESHPPIHTT